MRASPPDAPTRTFASFGAAAIATSAWSPGAREAFCSSATEITGDAPAAVTAARASRPLTPGTLAESLLDPLQRGHHVLDAGLRLRLRVERSLRLEVDALDVVQLEAFPPERGHELLARHQLVLEVLPPQMAVLVEHRARSVQDPLEPRPPEGEPEEHVVAEEQDGRAEQSAEQRVVVPDDRVLHDVRQQEQDDEVERAHLRELPLTCDPKQDEQAEVDRERPDHLVPPRQAEMDQVVGHALGFAARS